MFLNEREVESLVLVNEGKFGVSECKGSGKFGASE